MDSASLIYMCVHAHTKLKEKNLHIWEVLEAGRERNIVICFNQKTHSEKEDMRHPAFCQDFINFYNCL